jgi:uncharacterized protein YkwD
VDFCFPAQFSTEGQYSLEVLAQGPRGPEVAALLYVDVGHVEARSARAESEPATKEEAQGLILQRINRLRAAGGAPPMELDNALCAVAQAYGDRMAKEHFFSHLSPDGQSLTDRLLASGYPFRTAGENLGLSSGPLAAHFGIEESPGHRKNLMEPAFRRLGLGVAAEHLPARDQVLVVEVLAAPAQPSQDPLAEAYRGLELRRSTLHLRPLHRNAVLESLATEQAREALALDEPKATLPGPPLHERVFKLLQDARRASVDLYVTQTLERLPGSKNVEDAANDQVGIGAVLGDSARYGKGRYWVVVIYAGSAE